MKKFVLVTSIGCDDPLFPLNAYWGVLFWKKQVGGGGGWGCRHLDFLTGPFDLMPPCTGGPRDINPCGLLLRLVVKTETVQSVFQSDFPII